MEVYLQISLFLVSSGSKASELSTRAQIIEGSVAVGEDLCSDSGIALASENEISSLDGKVEVHELMFSWLIEHGSGLDVLPSDLPCL